MMCDGCKAIAAQELAMKRNRLTPQRPLKHTRNKRPHCEYPATCTCQHKPVHDGYVAREGVA